MNSPVVVSGIQYITMNKQQQSKQQKIGKAIQALSDLKNKSTNNNKSSAKKKPTRNVTRRPLPRSNIPRTIQASHKYGQHVVNPFSMGACHIPDSITQPSGLVQSISNTRTTFTALAGTSTSHAGGFVFYPYPFYTAVSETSAGNTILSDMSNVAGTTTNAVKVPNYAAIAPIMAHIRLVSLGVRVTYEGTELNRAGRYVAALLPIQSMDAVVATTGTQLSCFGPLNGATTMTTTQILNSAEKYAEFRMVDGPFEAHWLPRGNLQYKNFSGTNPLTVTSSGTLNDYSGNVDGQPGVTVSTPGAVGGPNAWNSVNTEYGCEVGQYALAVVFDGDTTSTATATSNTFAFEIVWNWEVIPRDPTQVAYTLTPSRSDIIDLSNSLNFIEGASVAVVGRVGGKNVSIRKTGNF